MSTMAVKYAASRLESQTTFLSSAIISPINLNLELLFLVTGFDMRGISHPFVWEVLFDLPVEPVSTTTRAILPKL
jgi:hypothetical protein